jgi:hypothetical protein
MPNPPVNPLRLAAVLAFFFVSGAAMLLFVWHTLSDFLAGKPVEGGRYLLALSLLGVFVGLAWLLALYLRSLFPSQFPDPDEG